MKLSKLTGIVKKHRYISVFTHELVQWVSVGGAAYPMYGMPPVATPDQLLSVMDVPWDEREGYTVDFIADPGAVFADLTGEDVMLYDMPALFQWRGCVFAPLKTDGGQLYWINERFLAPVMGADEIHYALRDVGVGMPTIAVFDGMSICAVIGVRIAPPEVEDALREMLEGVGMSWRRGYRVSREMVSRMGGYQIPVTGFVKAEVTDDDE